MTIPLHFITRYAVPFLVAALYLGNSDIREQITIFDKTARLADEALSLARREGEGTDTFDYIIVGAGSAGALLANRLTASGADRVLLLEAGGDPNPIREAPYPRSMTSGLGIDDWGYSTVKQTRGCLRNDGQCPYNRGKALGGSSSVNSLVYNRCKPKDFDSWANFTGDTSWSWENIWETFNSFEDYQGFYEDRDGSRHGHAGEMYVGTHDYLPGIEVMEEALQEKGFPLGDLNGGDEFTFGFGKIEFNLKDGLRWGTYQAFLQPILDRPNLIIYRYAHAIKIETMTGDGLIQAVGVTYQRHGVIRTALVNKEVILTGGVVGSPHLLMLSGIGPRENLDEVGIPTILDLPVGKYLQDHPGVDLNSGSGGFVVNTTFAKEHNTTENFLQFLANGTGPLMNAFNYEGPDLKVHTTQFMSGYITSSKNDDMSWPDLHIYLFQRYQVDLDRQEFYFGVELDRSPSTGTIKLASSDPNDKPVIDPNIFEDPEDIEKMIDGMEVMQDVFLNSEAFQKYGIQPIQKTYPPCEGRKDGRDYWRCVVEQKSGLFFHPSSTCRMGPNRSVAVLDSKMKVFGTQNIRVMDASSMPFVPSGNTNMPAMLMGARGAEIILSVQ